jgi:hypothetical protein
MSDRKDRKNLRFCLRAAAFALGCAGLLAITPVVAQAQAGWEGETGVFVTPLAYTQASASGKTSVNVAYHYFHAGPIIGDFHEISTEVGVAKRFEFGYMHEFHLTDDTGGLNSTANGKTTTTNLNYLWQDGFEVFNGKANVIPENFHNNKAIPAISVGFIARANVRNVGDYLEWKQSAANNDGTGKHNTDVYMVASKTVTQAIPHVPIVLNAGVRGTNAELWGMGGNSKDWNARAFGAVAFVFTGPGKSVWVFGSEAAQQPHHPLNYDSFTSKGGLPLNIPTTLTYCTRIVPVPKYHVNVDFGVAQVAGRIYNDGNGTIVDLNARHSYGTQITWQF